MEVNITWCGGNCNHKGSNVRNDYLNSALASCWLNTVPVVNTTKWLLAVVLFFAYNTFC